ncbi:4a-hydroxytetrahydrobiopterin dehydratase [Cupriavidus pinatubonensis]|uniref:Putative pterin-4-alpha-carbinolamine dehydratase n=1 Tax=Cupriavidus pinatubonensis TaxID=248026 RepID=A0ABM8W8U9_9BURK|nr:4a-hydroxytetrahydrobiopterin dehydratase [Cupriavidus pinatubonensis]CAG9163617.1 Putative pterin-4-alpha-carbinolamine dehydratase [Cupriavidus pinatubonensis]
MSEKLESQTCTPCRGGIPPLERAEAEALLVETPGWTLADDAGRLERSFTFRNFAQALEFVNGVGRLAEEQGHHPEISFGWGHATVSWRTKKIKGLHRNDFVMAAKTSELAAGMTQG